MLKSRVINGITVSYAIADPKTDDIRAAYQIGATVKGLGKDADIAMNFNYANDQTGVPIGLVRVDGKVVNRDISKTVARDSIYMLDDKTIHIGKPPEGAIWSLQGSPPLLQGGKNVVKKGIERDKLGTDIWANNARHLRVAAGRTVDGKLVVARTHSNVTLDQLAHIMDVLGCIDALNGDGGGSAYLYPEDNGWGRKLGSALTIKEGKKVADKLLIDAGHGGSDPGASGNGIIEKNYTLKISLYQYKRFKELGVPVELTRDVDKSLDADSRTALVRASGAKYCISNHINAAGDPLAAGTEVITSIYNDGKLAHAIANALKDEGQILRKNPVFNKANASGKDYYYMHRETGEVTTLIVEYGFLTNAGDADRIKANWEKYAEAVVRAYCSFIGHPYARPVVEVRGFTDIEGHWAKASILKALDDGILNGVSKDKFDPNGTLSRAQLCVILDRLGLIGKGVK